MHMNSKILIVATSHDQIGSTQQQTGLWFEELTTPFYVFKSCSFKVDIASIKGGRIPIDPKSYLESDTLPNSVESFIKDKTNMSLIENSLCISDIKSDDYDALFLPGGHGVMWDFSYSETLVQLILSFHSQNKVIGAVCHGPAAFVHVMDVDGKPIIKNKNMTGFTNEEEKIVQLEQEVPFLLESKLRELGANFIKSDLFEPNVITDGWLVTGQNPASSEQTAKKMCYVLNES